MSDHVRMRISIPPKYAVSQVIGYIKGKSAIHHTEIKTTAVSARLHDARGVLCRAFG